MATAEFLRWNLKDCCQKPELLCKPWAIAYSDCATLDDSLPVIAGIEKSAMIIELQAQDDAATKCAHGSCRVRGKVLTWNLPTATDIAPQAYQRVQRWIETKGQSIDFLLCDEVCCGGFLFAGQPVQTGVVNLFKSEQEYLQVWSALSVAFPAVHLPHQPTTSLDYSTRYQNRDGTAAFRQNPRKTKDEWAAEGKGRHQKQSRHGFVSPVQYQACWWIVSWLWEAIDALYGDDMKVPPVPGELPKNPCTRDRFCKKFAVRLGQSARNRLRSLTVNCTRVVDPVQLTHDVADFLEQIMVGPSNAHVMGYRHLHYRMFGNLREFCVPVAQKIAAFLPHVHLLIADTEPPVAPDG
jgi:hypothetical protein